MNESVEVCPVWNIGTTVSNQNSGEPGLVPGLLVPDAPEEGA